jgi:MarR family transcriptional repressor of emrRAB
MREGQIRDANVVGALALALADDLRAATERAGGHGGSGAAALVALDGPVAGSSIDVLSRVCGISHSGTVRLVDRLEAAELVERRLGADGRAVALWLTPAGRRVARRILARREAALAVLTPDERAALARAAETVLAAMAGRDAAEHRICRLCDTEACGRPRGLGPVVAGARRAGG